MIIRAGSKAVTGKWQTAESPLCLRSSVAAIVSCLALSGLPLAGHAASLGNIAVFSSLGQPLRAEIEVSAAREELAGMKAQLASPGAFKQANIDYVAILSNLKFSIDKRPNGQSIVKLKSDKPLNEPFVDVLLELNWPTGRLVREYTFLLDPPELAAKNVVPVTPAKTANPPRISSPHPEAGHSPSATDDEPPAKIPAGTSAQELNREVPDYPAGEPNSYEVKHGDTLQKIARQTRPDGVSLEQMLVGLWQANQKAFDGGNMNRLKVGQTLSTPDKATLEANSVKDARKIVIAQAADWHAYRQKLGMEAARGPEKEDVVQRDTAGKITTKIDDVAAPTAEQQDQLKVSRTETVRANEATKAKQSEHDLIARDKALQETNDRVASLEKNIAGIQNLIELKNQQLAALQKTKGADPAKPDTPAKPDQLANTSPAASEPAPPVAVKSAETPVSQQAPKPGANPEPTQSAPQEPAPEAGLIEELLGSPLLLAAGASLVLLVLVAGYFFNKRRAAGQTT